MIGAILAFYGFLQLSRRGDSKPELFGQDWIAVERGDILLTLDLVGELRPEQETFLRFPTHGIVAEILAREGENVQAGQALARLEDTEQKLQLLRAQQSPRQDTNAKMPLFPGVNLNASLGSAAEIQLGTRALGIDWTLALIYSAQGPQWHLDANWAWTPAHPESEAERLERELALQRAQAALDETVLYAPFAGVIGELRVHRGSRVTPEGDPVITLLDLSRWWVEAAVAERDLARLLPGQRATVTFEAFPDLTLSAELAGVHVSRPTEQVKQLKARLRILQDDPRLIPTLTARATVILQKAKNVLRVPLEAVAQVRGRSLVTRVRAEQLEEVEVKTGLSDDRWIEIRAGLAEGDLIVANNYQLYEKYRFRP